MRDSLTQLKHQAAETADSLSIKVKKFEQGIMQQASATKKDAERLFGPNSLPSLPGRAIVRYQIREHPLASISVAGLLGFFTTYWFENTWKPALRHIYKELEPELKDIKTAALTLLTKVASSQLKEAYPGIGNKLGEILTEKVPNYIPDDAIKRSEEGRAPTHSDKDSSHPIDKFSGESISPLSPSKEDVKSGAIDDTVMPG